MRVLVPVLLLLVATTALAAEPPTPTPISELEALRLEKAEAIYQTIQAEIKYLHERGERLKDQIYRAIQDLQRATGCEGCQIDLPNRRFVRPPAPKPVKPDGQE